MTINADNFVDVDEFAIPKGGLTDVTGTEFDLRKGHMLTQDFLASVPGQFLLTPESGTHEIFSTLERILLISMSSDL